MVGCLNFVGLALVQEVVDLAVAGGDLAVAGAGALPGRVSAAQATGWSVAWAWATAVMPARCIAVSVASMVRVRVRVRLDMVASGSINRRGGDDRRLAA
jgi:hypothetical protein